MGANELRRLDGDISPCDVLTLFSLGGFRNILLHENNNICLLASILFVLANKPLHTSSHITSRKPWLCSAFT